MLLRIKKHGIFGDSTKAKKIEERDGRGIWHEIPFSFQIEEK